MFICLIYFLGLSLPLLSCNRLISSYFLWIEHFQTKRQFVHYSCFGKFSSHRNNPKFPLEMFKGFPIYLSKNDLEKLLWKMEDVIFSNRLFSNSFPTKKQLTIKLPRRNQMIILSSAATLQLSLTADKSQTVSQWPWSHWLDKYFYSCSWEWYLIGQIALKELILILACFATLNTR